MVPTSRECRICGEEKALGEFHRDVKGKGGRRNYCRTCNASAVAKWQADRPEFKRTHAARRRARKRGATPELFTSAELYALWAEADAWACTFCGAPWEHREHFEPLARGGAHALWNLWPSCAACNLSKSDRDPVEFLRSRGVPRL